MLKKKICKWCNSEFQPYRKSNECCSYHCARKWAYKDRFDNCPICGAAKKKSSRTCSSECYHKSAITKITIKCFTCGKEIVRRKKEIQKNKRLFCSVLCAQQDTNVNKERCFATRKTMLEKYGVVSASQLPDWKDKVRATKLKRYGNATYNGIEKVIIKSRLKNYKKLFEDTKYSQRILPLFDLENQNCQKSF
jgi:hypothetical protein